MRAACDAVRRSITPNSSLGGGHGGRREWVLAARAAGSAWYTARLGPRRPGRQPLWSGSAGISNWRRVGRLPTVWRRAPAVRAAVWAAVSAAADAPGRAGLAARPAARRRGRRPVRSEWPRLADRQHAGQPPAVWRRASAVRAAVRAAVWAAV